MASLGPHYVRERFLDVNISVITATSTILCFLPTYDKDIINVHVLRNSLESKVIRGSTHKRTVFL